MKPRPFVIDVFADLVCPWCYLGEQRLRRAIEHVQAQDAGVEVEARWRPYQLNPDVPAGGVPWADFAPRKFGSMERAEEAYAHLRAAAEGDDVDFRFDRILNAPDTTDAHRLVLWAQQRGATWPLAERLFAAYFTEGDDLGDRDRLAHAAAEAGLDAAAARAFLDGGDGFAAVEESQRVAGELGVRGVPFYILGGRYSVSGAQPADVLARAIAGIVLEQSGTAPAS